MRLRNLLPLVAVATAVVVPTQAHADAPVTGVPSALQAPAQQAQQQLNQWQQQVRQGGLQQSLPETIQPVSYSNNLDGWIRNALHVLGRHGIPASYDGIHRNAMRESGGDPQAINTYDSNAAAGTPSKGLMQVIDPTFQAYHVDGTSWDIYDPVANIAAACNYAAHRYGSIDNVFGAY
ncbi:transglycosylase SLT domain-containing protein [Nocardia sienata]|uniref:transglycosylase SLT domain-containing protein n=1 Tax=Nocardia sienata TaxID=248552 RepID=UPI0009FCAC52|nr:transglycosylase SLT domain-containing protein [Nocardia sienata]